MKKLLILITVILGFNTVVFVTIAIVIDVKANLAVSNLQLADDSSTPEKKAEYLNKFIADMDKYALPVHAAWVFKSDRNKISNQKDVIRSLIKRCEDTAVLNKESMGYAQGMTQITGQEFDHLILSIKDIFITAICMSYGWFMNYGFWILLILTGICGVVLFVIL